MRTVSLSEAGLWDIDFREEARVPALATKMTKVTTVRYRFLEGQESQLETVGVF